MSLPRESPASPLQQIALCRQTGGEPKDGEKTKEKGVWARNWVNTHTMVPHYNTGKVRTGKEKSSDQCIPSPILPKHPPPPLAHRKSLPRLTQHMLVHSLPNTRLLVLIKYRHIEKFLVFTIPIALPLLPPLLFTRDETQVLRNSRSVNTREWQDQNSSALSSKSLALPMDLY